MTHITDDLHMYNILSWSYLVCVTILQNFYGEITAHLLTIGVNLPVYNHGSPWAELLKAGVQDLWIFSLETQDLSLGEYIHIYEKILKNKTILEYKPNKLYHRTKDTWAQREDKMEARLSVDTIIWNRIGKGKFELSLNEWNSHRFLKNNELPM